MPMRTRPRRIPSNPLQMLRRALSANQQPRPPTFAGYFRSESHHVTNSGHARPNRTIVLLAPGGAVWHVPRDLVARDRIGGGIQMGSVSRRRLFYSGFFPFAVRFNLPFGFVILANLGLQAGRGGFC